MFFNESFTAAARHEERCCEKENIFMYFLGCKGLWNDDIERWQGGTAFQEEIRPCAGFKTGDFVKIKVGGGLP